jgi:hypothetical protein
VFLLKNDFPENRFLDLAFVKCLYGLAKYKNAGRYNEVTRKLKKVEGESYILHSFLKEISKEQLNVIAYRHLYDMSKKYPSDGIFQEYMDDFTKEFALNSKVDFTNFKNQNFEDYKAELDSNLVTFDLDDSIRKVDESDLSKFQKIKLKKKLRELGSDDQNITGEGDFHLFALRDIVAAEDLANNLDKARREAENEIEDKEKAKTAADEDAKKSGYHLGIDKLLVIDPIYESYKLNNNRNHEKSEDKKISVASIYEEYYKRLKMDVEVLDSKTLNILEAEKYNEIGLINSWMSEVIDHEDIDMISSSHDRIAPICDKYATSKFMFSGIYGYKERTQATTMHVYGILLVYTAPFALADLLVVHNYFELVAFEVDGRTDEIEFAVVHDVNLKGINSILRVYIYDVLYQLSSEKKK